MSTEAQGNENLTDADKKETEKESVDIKRTDDEKADSNVAETTAGDPKTDDDKINDDTGKPEEETNKVTSPEPEYTPPESVSSWTTMDDANAHTDVPPQTKENEQSLGETEDNAETNKMSEAEIKSNDAPINEETEKSESTNKEEAENTETEQSSTNDNIEPAKTEEPSEPKLEEVKEEKEDVPVASGDGIDKEELEKKMKENEELQETLKSTLSNQDTERESYKILTEENAKLQKHHDDMKSKYEEMEGGHLLMQAEIDTFSKVNNEQREQISKLETEIKILKESQGGDDAVKDLQEKLIRLSNEQEEKDKKIHSLEGELDAAKEKVKEAESKAARGDNGDVNKSKTCAIM